MTGKSVDRSTYGEEHESAEDVLETIELGNPNLPADDIDIEAPRAGTTPPSEQSRSGVTEKDGAQESAPSVDGVNSTESSTTTAVSPSPGREPVEGGVALPAMQRQITTGSSKPYSAFPISTRWFISALVGVAAIFSPISSNIFVPAIPTLAQAFGKSEQDISLAVTVYLVFQAVTPSFFGSLSDTYGRRPVYIVTLSVYLCANIGLAVMPTTHYWLLLFLRGLQSTGGSAVISIGAGSVADVAEPRERGKFFAIFQLGAMLGPAVGPLIGGVLSSTLGWRSIFWFLVISCAVVLIPLIFVLPETLRSLVGDGSLPPPPLCMSPVMLWHRRQSKKELKARGEEKEHVERPPRKKYDPLSSFKMLLIPEIILTFVFVSLLYLQFYCILVLYSTALKDTYGLNDLKIGLAYLPNGAGVIVSTLINGRQLDWYFKKEEARAGGDYRKKGEEFRIDITRLRCLAPFFLCAICSSVAQGWCLQVKAPLAVTLVLGFFVGLGSGTINTATLYGQDLLPGKGGAVSASLNLVRCLFGAVGTATIQIMYNNVGAGWATVILSGICVAGVPLPLIVCKKASGWRTSRVERKSRKSANLEGR